MFRLRSQGFWLRRDVYKRQPMTVAAARISGEAEYGVGPEATGMIEKFVYETELLKLKPDARGMGFDCSRADLRVEAGAAPTAYEARCV